MKVFLTGAFSPVIDQGSKRYLCFEKVLKKYFKRSDIFAPIDSSKYLRKLRNDPTLSRSEADKMAADFELNNLRQSDLVICDLSPSTLATGLCLGVALEKNKEVIVCYEKIPHLSSLLTGAFNASTFIEYENLSELSEKLDKALLERLKK